MTGDLVASEREKDPTESFCTEINFSIFDAEWGLMISIIFCQFTLGLLSNKVSPSF